MDRQFFLKKKNSFLVEAKVIFFEALVLYLTGLDEKSWNEDVSAFFFFQRLMEIDQDVFL